MKPKIIVTGAPKVGKTTLVKKITEHVSSLNLAGFITEEVKGKKGRLEVNLKSMDGKELIYATQGKGRGTRVGKYLVDLDAFEEKAVEAISFHPEVDLYVIDEIGPMETLSRMFSATAKMLLKNEKVCVLATVAKSGRGFIREVKRLPGTEQIELTESNREQVERDILELIVSSVDQNREE
jgi:nucleoside-triphosphatase